MIIMTTLHGWILLVEMVGTRIALLHINVLYGLNAGIATGTVFVHWAPALNIKSDSMSEWYNAQAIALFAIINTSTSSSSACLKNRTVALCTHKYPTQDRFAPYFAESYDK